MYKFAFYVPLDSCERVKTALFSIGVGKIGNYDCCCWQVLGRGQFRPLQGSSPTIGQHGQIEQVEEWRVEMVCEDALIEQAVAVLKEYHPYEEVAYEFYKINDL